MNKNIKWSTLLGFIIVLFGAFLLEYFSLFVIEMAILKMDIFHYTSYERSIHHVIIVCLWIVYVSAILLYSRKRYHFPSQSIKEVPSKKQWRIALLCLMGCKIMTFIDWHTLKVIGEAQGKDLLQYLAQYAYYLMEVGIVFCIVVYGQKMLEVIRKKESTLPYGGIVLALTWGMFHFVSRGVGLEIWNGISCILFSLFSGVMYINLKRNFVITYLFIAIGYLL